MKIHEYQAKQILARYNVRIPRGEVAYNKEEARQIAERLGGTVVVKAQIHAGGRGKGGGVKLAKSPDEAAELAGVENAPTADVSEVHVHGEDPIPDAEEVSGPEEPEAEDASKPANLE